MGCSGDPEGKHILHRAQQMNHSGYSIGVPQGAAAMTAVEQKFPQSRIKYFQSLPDGYLAVQRKKIDAFAFDRHALHYVVTKNPDLALMDEKIADERIVVGAAPDRKDLIARVNAFIRQYRADGTYRDMYQRWIMGKSTKMPELPEPENPTMTLKIGTDGLNEPMNFYADGQLTGFDIEFTRRLALFLNAKVMFQTMEFSALVIAAQTGKIDLLVADLNATPERQKKLLFSDTYIDSEISFLVRKDRLDPRILTMVTNLSQLAGKKVGVLTGSTYDRLLSQRIPGAVPEHFNNFSDQTEAVKTGKIAGFLVDEPIAKDIINRTSGMTFLKEMLSSDGYAFALAKNQPGLHKQVDAALKEMRDNGTLKKLEAKWFGRDDAAKVLPDLKPAGKNGVIRLATNSNLAPFAYIKNGKMVGYDIEIATIIASKLGRKLEITDMDFAAFIPSLVSGKSDMAAGGIIVTQERAQSVLFTIPDYTGGVVVMVPAGTNAVPGNTPATGSANTITDISQLAGRKVGIVTGSSYDSLLKSQVPGAIPEYFNGFSDQTEAVLAGKIAGFLVDEPMARDIINHKSGVIFLKKQLSSDGYAFALAKSQPQLHEQVNAALKEMQKDGTIKKIETRWFGKDEAAKVLPDLTLDGKNGVIRFATNSGCAPFVYNKDGKIIGYDIEIVMTIARKLGRKLEIIDMEVSAIIPSLLTGKTDVAGCGLTVTKERAQSVLFTVPNYTGGVVVMVAAGGDAGRKDEHALKAADRITDIVQLAGKKVGVQTGTTYETVLKDRIPKAVPMYFTNFTDQIEAVKTKKIAGFLVDEVAAQNMIRQTHGLTYIRKWLRTNEYAFALAKDQLQLRSQVNAVLQDLRNDGTLKKLEAKWFGANDAVKVLPEQEFEARSGVIRFATNSDCAPFAYVKNGKLVGYDIEVATLIAAKLGRRLEIQDMDFAVIIPSLKSGKSDMAGAFIAITRERAQSVLFSIPNYSGGTVVMVAAAADDVKSASPDSFWSGLNKSFQRTFMVEDRYKLVLQGLQVTLVISILSAIFGTLLGFGVCMMRRAKTRWANIPARVFIRTIQGTPIVVLLMILYYIVFGSMDINAILVAIVGFSINFAAYVSEMMRTGMDAVDKGQHEAAYAIGFNKIQVFTKITFPQAARHVLPVFKGEFISMLKMTSVVGYIAIQDLTKMSDIIRSRTYEAFFPLIATALIYFVIAYAMTHLLSRVEMSVDPKRRKRVVKGVVRP